MEGGPETSQLKTTVTQVIQLIWPIIGDWLFIFQCILVAVEYLFHFEQTPVLYGGPLAEGYVFEFIHFHWGGNDSEGSEHHLNGRKYEVEMHAGHRNAKYRDLREAAQFNDGIAVLGFLFQVKEEGNFSYVSRETLN